MTTINVSLPDDLHQFVEHQVKTRGFSGPGHYIQALIARAKQEGERLEALLIEGLDSGEPIRLEYGTRRSLRPPVA